MKSVLGGWISKQVATGPDGAKGGVEICLEKGTGCSLAAAERWLSQPNIAKRGAVL